MKRLKHDLKRALNAFAWEHAGELLPDDDKARVLGIEGPPPGAGSLAATVPANPGREVALGLGSELSAAVMTYVLGICQGLGARLTVLTGEDPVAVRPRFHAFGDRLTEAGVAWRFVRLGGDPGADLARYVRENPRVMFVVAGGSDDPTRTLRETRDRGSLGGLPVPLVVVA